MELLDIVQLIAGLILLVVGGDWLVRGAENLAYSIKISPLVVGLTVVAFGTSAPELLISVRSALEGAPDIAVGNIVGSNICNLGLVLGLTALIAPIAITDTTIKVDWFMAMGASLLLYFFISRDFSVDHFEGFIFVLILVIYTYFQIEMSRKETISKLEKEKVEGEEDIPDVKGPALFKEILYLLIGCVALFFGAEWFVNGSIATANYFHVDKAIIGLTVVALGTSLPELVTSVVAAFHKNTDLAIGNLLGSCIFNVLSILGFTSLIQSIDVITDIVAIDIVWMLGITLLVLPLMIFRRRLGKVEGLILLVSYSWYTYSLIQRGIEQAAETLP